MLRPPTRIIAWTATGAVLAATLICTPEDALARRRRKARVGQVTELFEMFGLQGAAGNGSQVQLAFRLVDIKRRLHRLDTEYGWDRNGDGVIGEEEFLPAPTNSDDSRASIRRLRVRKRKFAERYTSLPGLGSVHAVIWDSATDVGDAGILLQEPLFDDDGRELRDRFTGAVVLAGGPGVQLRIRPRFGKGRAGKGDWVTSEPFSLDNRVAPELTLGPVAAGPATLIPWTAAAANSEDLDDDGVLDPGEDANGNGALDDVRIVTAFDWYRLAPGQDPAAMTEFELDELDWEPCRAGAGGTATTHVGVNGHAETFAWDAASQIPAGVAQYILRARALAADTGKPGDWVYVTTPITLAR